MTTKESPVKIPGLRRVRATPVARHCEPMCLDGACRPSCELCTLLCTASSITVLTAIGESEPCLQSLRPPALASVEGSPTTRLEPARTNVSASAISSFSTTPTG